MLHHERYESQSLAGHGAAGCVRAADSGSWVKLLLQITPEDRVACSVYDRVHSRVDESQQREDNGKVVWQN